MPSPFAQFAEEKGLSLRMLAAKTGIPEGSIWRVSAGTLSKDHPMLPKVASALGVPLATIQSYQHGNRKGHAKPAKHVPRGKTPHNYAAGSFGAFLQAKGHEHAATSLPKEFQSLGRKLQQKPETVAPNSPMLPALAKELGVSLTAIQAFAKAPPMEARWLKKIQSQLDRGTVPRGAKHSRLMKRLAARRRDEKEDETPPEIMERRRGKYRPRTPFSKYLWSAHQLTTKQLGVQLGINDALATKISMGLIAKNHPVVKLVAASLRISMQKVEGFMQLAPMQDYVLLRIAKSFSADAPTKTPGKALVHVPTAEMNGNGNGHSRVVPQKYNRLKKQEIALRQAARDMVTTLNLAVMEGKEYAPPIRTLELHAVLKDYLTEKGLRANVLVDPDFAEFFDPK